MQPNNSGDFTPDTQPELSGVLAYVGTTGTGKTYLALQHLEELRKQGKNCIVVDSLGAKNFADKPHVESVEQCLEILYGKTRGTIGYWTPLDIHEKDGELTTAEAQFDKLCEIIRTVKGEPVAILVDEVSHYKDSREFKTLCRVWRHANATVLVTSQHVSADIGQVLFGCNPTLYLFRTTAPRSLEFLMRWHGLDPDEIRKLPDRKFVTKKF